MSRNDFYVGYLPLPGGLKRFLMMLLPMLVLAGVVSAVVIAQQQKDPGDGIWTQLTDGATVTMQGTYLAEPYPMLAVGQDRGVAVFAIVAQGKQNAAAWASAQGVEHGEAVELTAFTLKRDSLTLLELQDEQAIRTVQAETVSLPLPSAGQPVTLRGEIIDPKCYAGAMKPGEGITHRACAILCLRGGIPPMFVTRHADGSATYYLITGPQGEAILEPLLPYVGLQVEIQGDTHPWGNLRVLRVGEIRQL